MQDGRTAPLKPGAVARVLRTVMVTAATRRAIERRLSERAPIEPVCFDSEAFATLVAVCDRLIPQTATEGETGGQVDLAARLDARLATGVGKGWRYDVLPPDREAITGAVAAVDAAAWTLFGTAFTALAPDRQDTVLIAVQDGSAKVDTLDAAASRRAFEELLAAVVELYYSHPYAQEQIGYIGMADAGGFRALGLNARDPVEEEASLASL